MSGMISKPKTSPQAKAQQTAKIRAPAMMIIRPGGVPPPSGGFS
jgi:hypothetical protein